MAAHRPILLAATLAAAGVGAYAHCERGAHFKGGLMNRGGELCFEMVATPHGVRIYIEDHGEPVPTEGSVATWRMTRGDEVQQVALSPKTPNLLQGRVPRFRPGDTVQVRTTLAAGAVIVGNFTIPDKARSGDDRGPRPPADFAQRPALSPRADAPSKPGG